MTKTTAELKAEWKAARAEVEAIRARGDLLTCEIECSGQTPERLAQLVEVDRLISEAEDRAALAGSTYMASMV